MKYVLIRMTDYFGKVRSQGELSAFILCFFSQNAKIRKEYELVSLFNLRQFSLLLSKEGH